MEWLSQADIDSNKNYRRESKYSKIKLRKVSMVENLCDLQPLALKVYFELTKIKSSGQIEWWVKNSCGISTTYVRSMTKLEMVLFINIFLTVPPCKGKEIYN